MIKNILVEVDEIKLKAWSPIIKVISGAQAINNADKIKAFCGNCRLDRWPKAWFHLPLPWKVTENKSRPALYKKLLVDETAAEITTKLMIKLAFLIPVAPSAWTNGLELVATFDQGITNKIPKIAMT